MIVICRDNSNYENGVDIDKEYTVVEETNEFYYIIDNFGAKRVMFKTRFKKIKENMKPKLNLFDITQNWYIKGDQSEKLANALYAYSRTSPNSYKQYWIGTGPYYYGVNNNRQINGRGIPSNITQYTVEEFLEAWDRYQNPWTPKVGELVEVRRELGSWHPRIYIGQHPISKNYMAVEYDDEHKYNSKLTGFTVVIWEEIRKIEPKVEVNISIKVNGEEKDPSTFTNEQWLALKNSK